MRKSPIIITATTAGLVGVLGFHTRKVDVTIPAGGGTGGATTSPSGGHASSRAGAGASGASSPTGGNASSAATGHGSSPAGGSGQSAHAAAAGSSSSPARSGAGSGSRTAAGKIEQYGYGELSVRVSVKGGRIVNVSIAQIQVADSYSAQLAQYVVPTLRSEVLHVQSANIQGISGATYTSYAYQASLQSALDKLHVR